MHEIVSQGAHIYKCNNTVNKKNKNIIGEELRGCILEKEKIKKMQVTGKWHNRSMGLLMIHHLV